MTKKLRYMPSTGETVSEPSVEFLREIIFNPKSSDWRRETTGGSLLDFYEGELNTYRGDLALLFFYDEPHGFFLYYDLAFVPVRHDADLRDGRFVVHYVGGEPMHVPLICYRTSEEAWEIITKFIEDQGKLDKFRWVMLGDIDYPREYPDT